MLTSLSSWPTHFSHCWPIWSNSSCSLLKFIRTWPSPSFVFNWYLSWSQSLSSSSSSSKFQVSGVLDGPTRKGSCGGREARWGKQDAEGGRMQNLWGSDTPPAAATKEAEDGAVLSSSQGVLQLPGHGGILRGSLFTATKNAWLNH